jgi:branched-chain amino acid transport system permease protein
VGVSTEPGPANDVTEGLAEADRTGLARYRSLARNPSAGIVLLMVLAFLAERIGSSLLQSALLIGAAYALLAMGTNVIFGWSGLFPFGQAAIFGAGVYGAAFVRNYSLSAPVVLLIAGGIGLLLQLIFMAGFARFSSMRFGILTLVGSQVLFQFASTSNLLGAVNDGFYGIPRGSVLGISLEGNEAFWWYTVATVAVCLVGYFILQRSVFGLWLNAHRDDSARLMTLRRSVVRLRCASALPAGFLCGVGGGLYAQFSGSANSAALDFSISGIALFMCLLGGRDYAYGPLVGALAYCVLTQDLLYGSSYPDVIIGIALMVLIVALPNGLFSIPKSVGRMLTGRRKRELASSGRPAS